MLESILSRLLNQILGDYIEGFDANNLKLSLWKGQVNIENVRLRADIFNRLSLPFRLKFSFVRKIRIKIPWSSLFSSKTEVFVEGVYAVLSGQPQKDWKIFDSRLVERRKAQMVEFKQEVIKRWRSKLETKEQGDSFGSKVLLKVIDNLQVELKQMHIRYEDDQEEEYAFGMTLDQLKLATVNKDGQEEFVDRDKGTPNQGIRKKITLNNFAIYWFPKAQMTKYDGGSEEPILKSLKDTILSSQRAQSKQRYNLLRISFVANLTRTSGKTTEPNNSLTVEMQTIEVGLDSRQLQQAITLSQKMQKFRLALRKSTQKPPTAQEARHYLTTFIDIYTRNYNFDFGVYPPEDAKKLEEILSHIPVQHLLRPMKQVIQDNEKKRMIAEKEKEKSGWFSRYQITEEETKAIETFLINNLNEDLKPTARPSDFWHTVIQLKLNKVLFNIEGQEGILITFSELNCRIALRDGGFSLNFEMDEMLIQLLNMGKAKNERQEAPRLAIFQKFSRHSDQKYLKLHVQSNPIGRPDTDTEVSLQILSSLILFHPLIIQRLQRFTKLKVSEKNKQAALEKYGQLKTKTSKSFSRTITLQEDKRRTDLKVKVRAPLFLIPFEPGSKGQCWAINMGLFEAMSKQADRDQQAYQINLKHVHFGWFNTVQACLKYYERGVSCRQMQNLIEDFMIDALIIKNNKEGKAFGQQSAVTTISIHLPILQIKTSEYSYALLHTMGSSFAIEKEITDSPTKVTSSNEQRLQILRNKEKIGILYKRSNASKLWQRYTAVLSGNYLYLYIGKNQSYEQFIFVKNSLIRKVPENESGRENTIRLDNKVDEEVYLSFDKEEHLEDWIKIFESKREEEESEIAETVLKEIDQSATLVKKVSEVNYNQPGLLISVKLDELKLVIFKERPDEYWLFVSFTAFLLQAKIFPARFHLKIILTSFNAYDRVDTFKDPSLDFLIKTNPISPTLIQVEVKQTEHHDPTYQDIDNDVSVHFGVLCGNWKPKTIRKIFVFFLPNEDLDSKTQKLLNNAISDIFTDNFKIQPQEPKSINRHTSLLKPRTQLKLHITVEQIKLRLVNLNTKVVMYDVIFSRLGFLMTTTTFDKIFRVSAGNLQLIDKTGYPFTIVSEDEWRQTQFTMLKSKEENNDELVCVNVKIINSVGPGQKDLFLNIKLNHIQIDLVLQELLRFINYVIYQFVDYIGTPAKYKADKVKEVIVKHPQYSTWAFELIADDALILLKPNPYNDHQKIQLSVEKVIVTKHNLQRPFIDSKNVDETVLVTQWAIEAKSAVFKANEHSLSNDLDVTVLVDSIEQPLYYLREYGDKFKDGLRLYLNLSSFALRLSNKDIRLLIKCIQWNIAYNDNCDHILQIKPEQPPKTQSQPLYLDVSCPILTFVAAHDNLLPFSCLSLHHIHLGLIDGVPTQGITIDASLGALSACSFLQRQPDRLTEVSLAGGVIEQLSYAPEHLMHMKDLVRLFYERDQQMHLEDNKKQLVFRMIDSQEELSLQATVKGLKITLELITILKMVDLVKLQPQAAPKPRFEPKFQSKKPTKKPKPTVVRFQNTDAGISMVEKGTQIGLSGDILVEGIINEHSKGPLSNFTIQCNNIRIFLSQTDIKKITKKRAILQPTHLQFSLSKVIDKTEKQPLIIQTVKLDTQAVEFKINILDLLTIQKIVENSIKITKDWERIHQRPEVVEDEVDEVSPIKKPNNQVIEKKQSSAESIVHNVFQVNLEQAQIQLINDCGGVFVPILQFLIFNSKPVIRMVPTQLNLGLILIVELNFFNPRSANWQPILERCSFQFGFIINKIPDTESTEISLQTHEDMQLSLNISSQMVRALHESYMLARKEMESSERRVFFDGMDEQLQVSAYVFQNLTNMNMQIVIPQTRDGLSNPPSNQAIGRRTRLKQLPSRYKGSVSLPGNCQQIMLRFADMNHRVNINLFGKRRIPESNYFVECKIEKLNRLLKITGEYYLQNKTNQNIYLQNGQKIDTIVPQAQYPLDGIKDIVLGGEPERLSKPWPVKSIVDQTSIVSFQGRHHLTICRREMDIGGLASVKLYVCPPLKIINCLPRDILYQVLRSDGTPSRSYQLKSQVLFEFYRYPSINDLAIKIALPGYLWSQPYPILSLLNKQVDIVMKDKQGHPTVIKLALIQRVLSGSLTLTIFTSAYLINDTPYDLLIYSLPKVISKETQYVVAGQLPIHEMETFKDGITILGSEVGTQIKLAEKSTPDELSSVVRIDQLGYHDTLIEIRQPVNGRLVSTYLTLGIDVQIKQMHKDCNVVSKEVRVTARHVMYNMSDRKLFYRQKNTAQFFELDIQQRRVAFLLDNRPENRYIIFRTSESEESAEIPLRGLGTVNFEVLEKGKKLFMKITVRVVRSFVFLAIEILPHDHAPYQIYNRVKNLTISVPELEADIKYKEKSYFSWRNPQEKHKLTLSLFRNPDNKLIDLSQIDPDDATLRKNIQMETEDGKTLELELFCQTDDKTDSRVWTLRKVPKQPPVNRLHYYVRTRLGRMGISFILNHEAIIRPYEFIYGYIEDAQFVWQLWTFSNTLQFKLKFMQFDQNHPNELMTPVIFTPQKYFVYRGQQNQVGGGEGSCLLNVLVQLSRKSKRHINFQVVKVHLNDVTVRISQQFIKVLRDITKENTQNQKDFLIKSYRDQWIEVQMPKEDNMLYFQDLKIYRFNVQLTCHIKPHALQESKGYVLEQVAVRFFGGAFANIEQAFITLNGIELKNNYETIEGLISKLAMHYQKNLINQVYKIFGSLNIIGNPMGLFNNITTGLTEFVQAPMEGAINGPIELGKGLAKGTHSLIAHTVGGALNSFSQLTSGVSNGLSILTFDDRFDQLREKERMEPPKGPMEGLGKGITSVYTGFREGAIGLVRQPVVLTQKHGVLGSIMGVCTGLTGAIVKPVTGILDGLSNTSEGLRALILGYEDRANSLRIRAPRIFYGSNSLIKSYNQTDAEVYQLIEHYDPRYSQSAFIQSFTVAQKQTLIVLQNFIILLDSVDRTIIWSIQVNKVGGVNLNDHESTISIVEKDHDTHEYQIVCEDQKMRSEIMNLLNEMSQLSQQVIDDPMIQ